MSATVAGDLLKPPESREFKRALSTTNQAGQGIPRKCGIFATAEKNKVALIKLK
jgi:hypothetical protein